MSEPGSLLEGIFTPGSIRISKRVVFRAGESAMSADNISPKTGRPTSWTIRCISTGECFEVFTKANVDKATASNLFFVEETGEYLARINREIAGK